ncbi:MAG: hypothetical protein IPG00_20690 [Saprospiraceae bacterium]|nr:hypothetical protein [Saprospiraceae bacterium]
MFFNHLDPDSDGDGCPDSMKEAELPQMADLTNADNLCNTTGRVNINGIIYLATSVAKH